MVADGLGGDSGIVVVRVARLVLVAVAVVKVGVAVAIVAVGDVAYVAC